MQDLLKRYITLVRRWAWLVVLGVVFCAGASYVVSTLLPPVYQASATLVISLKSADSAADNVSASEMAVLTYAQLLTNPVVLEPVVAKHPGITLQQLNAMTSVNTQSNTQLLELDVKNENPQLATQLANEIAQSFARFSQTQLPITMQIVPAQLPTLPISPRRSSNTVIAALVGFGLALALIVVFEWIDDLPSSAKEVEELLDMEILAVIPQVSGHQQLQSREFEKIPALVEGCQLLCAFLEAQQATKPLKLMMVTSALSGEGKSTVAVLLASLLARSGKSVLLADANLRNPVLDQRFQIENTRGLADALREEGTATAELYRQAGDIATLSVLTAGAPAANPAGLLQSPALEQLLSELREAPFDYIIFDTPALLPVADPQLLALHMQAILLVIDGSKAPRRALSRTGHVLRRFPNATGGVVLNNSRGSFF